MFGAGPGDNGGIENPKGPKYPYGEYNSYPNHKGNYYY